MLCILQRKEAVDFAGENFYQQRSMAEIYVENFAICVEFQQLFNIPNESENFTQLNTHTHAKFGVVSR